MVAAAGAQMRGLGLGCGGGGGAASGGLGASLLYQEELGFQYWAFRSGGPNGYSPHKLGRTVGPLSRGRSPQLRACQKTVAR
jgi:hypothetical protein